MRVGFALLAAAAVAAGCCRLAQRIRDREPTPTPPVFSQYHLDAFAWDGVGRVLVLPVLNESPYTRAGDEIRAALTSELQRQGRFEVIAAPSDALARLSRQVHRAGTFDERVMLELGRETQADVVVLGTVTQYSPYPRPRLGLVLQAVGPREAKVVASVDGLWDTTDAGTAERVRAYYRQRPRPRPWVRNHTIASDDGFAGELALDSPALFQRFVCHEAAAAMTVGVGASGAGPSDAGPPRVLSPLSP